MSRDSELQFPPPITTVRDVTQPGQERHLCVVTKCVGCGTNRNVFVPTDGFWEWMRGTLIQRALPTISADDREPLISGTCST
jgi:hypothetical protein